MAMKILNQFIDDFVGVFQYRFMDTFQYFKERKKSKYLGDRFEEWVVNNSNISKEGYGDEFQGFESKKQNYCCGYWRGHFGQPIRYCQRVYDEQHSALIL